MRELSKKVILLGNLGVGKTSLVNRFVFNRFSESYFSTIGVRIEKKSVEIDSNKINMIVWDIAGERNQENTPQSYLLGTNGIIYVVDISNPTSYQNAESDITYLKKKLPTIPILLIANKVDLISVAEKASLIKSMPIKPDIFTSAKSNQNVELVFDELGRLILLNS
jgi:small GTP-binding protein